MDLGTLSAVLIVSGTVLLVLSIRARIIIREHDRIEDARRRGARDEESAEESAEEAARRRGEFYLSTALYEYERRCEEERRH